MHLLYLFSHLSTTKQKPAFAMVRNNPTTAVLSSLSVSYLFPVTF